MEQLTLALLRQLDAGPTGSAAAQLQAPAPAAAAVPGGGPRALGIADGTRAYLFGLCGTGRPYLVGACAHACSGLSSVYARCMRAIQAGGTLLLTLPLPCQHLFEQQWPRH
jgi:hypothetical protein